MPRSSNNSLKSVTPMSDRLSSDQLSCISEEGKVILTQINDKLDTSVAQILARLDEHIVKIKELEGHVLRLKLENTDMRERLDELEADQRDTSLIISGESIPNSVNGENVASITQDLIKSKLNYELPLSTISAAYRIGKKPTTQAPDRRPILLKLQHGGTKNDLRRAGKTVKPTNLYINENLIPSRARILQILRRAKRKYPNKISACGSQNGRVYVWLTASTEGGNNTKVFVNNESKLEDLCVKSLGVHSSDLDGRQ